MEFRLVRLGAGVVVGGLLTPGVSAQIYEDGTDGAIVFYGQFSPAWLSFDDGRETTDAGVDDANSNTRLGVLLTQPLGANTLTFNFETSLGLRQSSEVSQDNDPPWIDWQRTDIRKFEVAYSGRLGTVTFGQGSMASDNTATVDFSGTNIAGTANVPDVAGSFFFREEDGPLSDIAINDAFSDFDGSRRFRLRYDTPDFAGFSAAAAYGQDVLAEDDQAHYYDVGLRWAGEAGDLVMGAAAGYSWTAPETGDTRQQYDASASLSHTTTGLSISVAGGADPDGGSYGYVKGGWAGDLVPMGPTALSVDYYGGRDFVTGGSTSAAVGVSAVQDFTDADLQVYLGWRRYDYGDDTDVSYQDAQSVLVGARWRF